MIRNTMSEYKMKRTAMNLTLIQKLQFIVKSTDDKQQMYNIIP